MKASKVLGIFAVILAVAILICAGSSNFFTRFGNRTELFAGDFSLRHSEILCAHQGVNSFHVWNRDIVLPGFRPFQRPDMPNVADNGELTVHAYPPWEVCYFYFFGWLPFNICLALMACLFGVCLYYIVQNSFLIARQRMSACPDSVAIFSLLLIISDVTPCFIWMNYSVLVLALFILMYRAVGRGNQVLAGLCWAVMMIKPQMGILFFWPLIIWRQYKVIAVAMMTCLVATVAMSFIYNESVLALLLQIPQIGAPYVSSGIFGELFGSNYGGVANMIWMGLCFMLCGMLCMRLRKSNDFLSTCVSVAVFVPIWTYSQSYDHVILWVLYIVAFAHILPRQSRLLRGCFVAFLCCELICTVWTVNMLKGHFFDPQGLGWIYYAAKYGKGVLIAVLAVKCVASEMSRICLLHSGASVGSA